MVIEQNGLPCPCGRRGCWEQYASATALKRMTAEALAAQYGVAFLYRDFRPGFREGQRQAREMGFYMQKYCGCVFSEEERYAKAITRDMQEPEKHL